MKMDDNSSSSENYQQEKNNHEVDNQKFNNTEIDEHENNNLEINNQEMNDSENDEQELNKEINNETDLKLKIDKKNKTGVIHLTKIPPGRNYTRIREIFEKFAPVGNIYLVPDKLANSRLETKGKKYKNYKEGFVEFKRKKDAKNCANVYNGTILKTSGSKNFIWEIRYLHRVKWRHIMAKFKHNKALEEQRLRLETEKARETADHYLDMVNEWKKRNKTEGFEGPKNVDKIEESLTRKQKKTKKELISSKKTGNRDEKNLNELYETIFG